MESNGLNLFPRKALLHYDKMIGELKMKLKDIHMEHAYYGC